MDEPFLDLGKNKLSLSCVELLPLLAYFEFLPTMLNYSSLRVLAFACAGLIGLPFPPLFAPVSPSSLIKEGDRGRHLERKYNPLWVAVVRVPGAWWGMRWPRCRGVRSYFCVCQFLLCNLDPVSSFSHWASLSPLSPPAVESSCPRILLKFQFWEFFKWAWPWSKYVFVVGLFFFFTETSFYSFPVLHSR